ncbi:MAG: IS200/IS605 family accessory protein TnpB-related protein [Umezawaea sp.]
MLRAIASSFVVPGPSGVAIRTRLKGLSAEDEQVLRLVGAHLGSLAAGDLKTRCADGLDHSSQRWADRKRDLTAVSSSRWAGSITKASHDQWALARRCQAVHVENLRAGVAMVERRLALPVGSRGGTREPGGYRSRHEWFVKSRRLGVLRDRLAAAEADRGAGRVRVVRGGKRLLNTRHHLDTVGVTEERWRERWEAERWFLQADGEAGKRFGNETIRITPDGEVSIKLPAPLAGLANARHGRYALSANAVFAHRGPEWAGRVEANQAVAYRIHYDTARDRWYVTAAWQHQPAPIPPLTAAGSGGVVGVDMNDDHLAAWRLDPHGNPVGEPRRFRYDLSGTAQHRDAQLRHALTRLLHFTRGVGVSAIAVEDLDFADSTTREKHGRKKRFRQLISRFPTARLRARLVSMATDHGIAVIAVDPAYTSRWGAQHWRTPLSTPARQVSRHDAASVAIGRRALGYPIRRRTAPPRDDQSDRRGHRTIQALSGTRGREETRPHPTGPRTRSAGPGRGVNAGDQDAQHRSGHPAEHTVESDHWDSLTLSP